MVTKLELKPFNMGKRRKRAQQKFNKEEIQIEMKGKKINMYDMIQEARKDTELYPTLEKYGCIPQEKLDEKKANAVYGDLTAIKGMRSAMEQQKMAENLWANLPLETRKEFGHNKYEFMDNGMEWLKRKIEAAKEITEIKATGGNEDA